MLGSVLEANAHVIMVSTMEHNALVGAINQSHLSVDETVFEAFAACYAAGLPENRPEGIALLDIGAQSSELVVYFGNALQLASTIGLSGDHFTSDIAHFLRISFADAARDQGAVRLGDSGVDHRDQRGRIAGARRPGAAGSVATGRSTRCCSRAPTTCSRWCSGNWRASAWSTR